MNTLPGLHKGNSLKHSNNLGSLNECETGERVCVRVCVKKEENGTRGRERGEKELYVGSLLTLVIVCIIAYL